ncbi:MAG: NAD-dependent epimerase/dehydratase family protein, partial [Acidimicrobiales bacterium]
MSGPSPSAPLNVAITGASGLVGTALTARLESLGHTVRPVVRRDAVDREIPWNPAEGIIEPRDFVGLDAVVHLAGAGIFDRRWNPEHKRAIRDSRTRGTALLAEA